MSVPRTEEERLLAPLQSLLGTDEARLDVLEGAASLLGGFSLRGYRRTLDGEHALSESQSVRMAEPLVRMLRTLPMHHALGLSALARPQLSVAEQRRTGAYYTDFRLAQHLAAVLQPRLTRRAQVIDPASGTGILLVAAALAAKGTARWLGDNVTACDLSAAALRGARLALASLCDDVGAIAAMTARWRCQDSLIDPALQTAAFDVVIANPPWEKIKLTRHEFAKEAGHERHYGSDYQALDAPLLGAKRGALARYIAELASRYRSLGQGEVDLYKPFVELCVRLLRDDGALGALVPAGLIRSHGSEDLRRLLLQSGDVAITVLDNRARFFAIDTRFKFLALQLTRTSNSHRVALAHASGSATRVTPQPPVVLQLSVLRKTRPDLTVPEVRTSSEWQLFRKLSNNGEDVRSERSRWFGEIVREVDMTRDRAHFCPPQPGAVAIVEGRMVHQHRFGAKMYCRGSGRAARWEPVSPPAVGPQFCYPAAALPPAVRARTGVARIGFCDITGQTNERSMLAALIPPGVVCGNKVPTITFPDASAASLLLWLGVANSFAFDWALRRLVTTSVNYFVLRSVPFPRVRPERGLGKRIAAVVGELYDISDTAPLQAARLRALIDVMVAEAYGLSLVDLALILRDFPLLDRGQPPLPGEARSTITRDFLLYEAARYFAAPADASRVEAALRLGALPFVPSEFADILAARVELPLYA